MTAVRLRQTAHNGSVLAAGLAIDTRITGEAEARRRILHCDWAGDGLPQQPAYVPGVVVFRAGPWLIAKFPATMRLSAAASPGTPLVRYGRLMSAAPLAEDETAALMAGHGHGEGVVLVEGGAASVTALGDDIREDAASWADISDFVVIAALVPLGKVSDEPHQTMDDTATDVRQTLGVEPLNEEAAKMLRTLLARGGTGDRAASDTSRREHRQAPGGSSRIGWGGYAALGVVLSLMAVGHPLGPISMLGWLLYAFSRTRSTTAAQTVPGTSQQRLAEPRAGALSRLLRGLARALWTSPLGRFMAGQHLRYFARLLNMFDGDDIENALRHAIPLNAAAQADTRDARLPFWTPRARKDLTITNGAGGTRSALAVGGGLYDLLQARYRRAFERLKDTGQIEKAAFVLAELLNENEEAVAFLEQHRRLRLAAEIAEARNLRAGIQIRQWFLAGDRQRAIQIAYRTGAFADAVVRLENSHPEQARMLRQLWANTLAAGGNYAAAVDAMWPIEDARRLALAWLDRAIEIGGPTGARMLARKARLSPEDFASIRDVALAMLAAAGDEAGIAVRAFGQELLAANLTPETQVLARATARRLLADAHDRQGHKLAQSLVESSGDAVLRADMRPTVWEKWSAPHPNTQALNTLTTPLQITRAETDRGTGAILDAALLPDGRILCALGDLGAVLLSREGKVITRFADPVQHIVISDHGDRAILIARHGEICRLSRLDLVTRSVQPWCDTHFTCFAADFDGLTWFVAKEGTLYAIDTTIKGWSHVWKVAEEGTHIGEVSRNANMLSVLWMRAHDNEVWTYDLPSITLRRRQEIDEGDKPYPAGTISAGGLFAGWRYGEGGDYTATLHFYGGSQRPLAQGQGTPDILSMTENWAVVLEKASAKIDWDWAGPGEEIPARTTIKLIDMSGYTLRARITLPGDLQQDRVGTRIQDERLVIWDSCGRLMVLSLATGELLRDHRLP